MKSVFTGVVVIGLFCAGPVLGQQIYRCVIDGQTVLSDRPCANEAKRFDVRRAYDTGQPVGTSASGVEMSRTTCQTRGTGTAEAIVELKNTTGEFKSGELVIQFVNRNSIVGVERIHWSLQPLDSDAFSRLGPLRTPVDRCEYSLRVDR